MAHVTMKDLQERIAIHEVERDARARWERGLRKRRRVEHWIVRALPFAVLIMAAVFYALSAPHTAGILDIITPGWGRYAPIGWELGILAIAAFIEAGVRTRVTHFVLYTLLVMAVIINISGAFIAVAEFASGGNAALNTSTLPELLQQFGGLPARFQVVLLLVIPIGAVIPVIAKLTGEIIIKLAMGHIKLERVSDNVLWAQEAQKIMHAALMQAALTQGAGVKTASTWAANIAEQMYGYLTPAQTSVDARGQSAIMQPTRRGTMAFQEMRRDSMGQSQMGQSQSDFIESPMLSALNASEIDKKDSPGAGQSQLSQRVIRSHVAEWMAARPELLARSDREIARLYMQDVFGVDSDSAYKTVQRARRDMR